MVTYYSADPLTISRVLDIVIPTLRKATSEDDLRRRLEKIGYGFRDTVRGRMLTTVPHGVEITALPMVRSAL